MGLFGRLFGKPQAAGQSFASMNDPAFLEYVRMGGTSTRASLETAAVYRCVSLISSTLGMLPMRLLQRDENGEFTREATGHPLWPILCDEPNFSQSAYTFKKLLTVRMLTHGDGYARIVRTGSRIAGLVPLDPGAVSPRQMSDGSIEYAVATKDGSVVLKQDEVLHVFDTSIDGVSGVSILKLAADAVHLSSDTCNALGRIYRTGVSATGALTHPQKLSKETKERMRAQLEEKFSGPGRAGGWFILDEGMKAEPIVVSPRDGQMIETARHAVEDIARFFGVPRPLLGLDDTSWGSGVEQLATLFVRFGMSPLFSCWEQAVSRSLLSRAERKQYRIDIDERELLRGSMKDQGEFFARALGAGGHRPWMEPNEVRDLTGLVRKPDGGGLQPAQQIQGQQNVASQAA